MYKVSVNDNPEIEVIRKKGKYYINNQIIDFDIVSNTNGSYHVLHNGKSYTIDVLEKKSHRLLFTINKQKTEVKIKNDLEDLLSKMGMDKALNPSMNELKAPMPGMVLKVMVSQGQEVKKGDSLLVLEAMKMENNIKALGDGTVKMIKIKEGDKVEKNQVLILF